MQEAINEVVEALYEDVSERLKEENFYYSSQIYNLGTYDITKEAVDEYIKNILTDEKMRKKFVNGITKSVLEKNKKKEAARKAEIARSNKLFQATKGKIPCLMECGYVQIKTKEEVQRSSNNFICSGCCLNHGDDIVHRVIDKKNIYKMFNIQ